VDGPAVNVFERKLGGGLVRHPELPALDGVAFVLCGSSGAATLERRAVRRARAAGVRCAVWLDHWTNYAMRFELDGAFVLPSEVWVCDEHAAALARAELPGADVRVKGNPYLEDFAGEVRALERASGPREAHAERILYVTEPTSFAAEALEQYLRHLAESAGGGEAELRIRTHPAEPADKYDAVLGRHAGALRAQDASGGTLAEDVAWADTVVGCDTMAMIAAAEAGRRVISVLPPDVQPHLPPDARIERPFRPTHGAT